jgi:hypothetical protein
MNRYEKLGIRRDQLKLEGYLKAYEIEYSSIISPTWIGVIPHSKSGIIHATHLVALCHYLLNNDKDAIEYCLKISDFALEYFYGTWRNEVPTDDKIIDPVWWKRMGGGWIDEFRHAMLWTTCLRQWGKVVEIAAYPTPECVEYLPIKVNPYLAYYLCLAVVIRGEKLESYKKYVEIIERGSRKKEKLMLEVLKAIDGADKALFDKAFVDYMKYYEKKEFPADDFDEKVSIDGTILFNIALHNNLHVEYPEEYIDYYIDLERKR